MYIVTFFLECRYVIVYKHVYGSIYGMVWYGAVHYLYVKVLPSTCKVY